MESMYEPQESVADYELITDLVQASDSTVTVACAKCGRLLIAAQAPTKRPACGHCYGIIEGLQLAREKGFRVGF